MQAFLSKVLRGVANPKVFDVAQLHIKDIMAQVPKAAKWGLPAAIAGGWVVYPALTPDFKKSMGIP